ncbi:MAG: 4-(cytidine 5'-diphospho)-2-C-methyl-D-erythritol kinase [Candidatus Cryosericum sp.]
MLHELESLFVPVEFGDRLIVDASSAPTPGFRLTSNRKDLLPRNSVREAWRAFSDALTRVPVHPCLWIDVHLDKRVPEQTGLGAGSGDAGAMLLLLNELYSFPFNGLQLRAIAYTLGSDVPFFVESGPCIVRGTGETVEPLPSFSNLTCCIVLPSFRIDTGVAYRALDDIMAADGPSSAEPSVSMQAVMGALTARESLHPPEAFRLNAFDAVLGENSASFLAIRDTLLANGAIISDLSGSGSAVFGIYAERAAAEAAALDIRRLSEHVRTIVAEIL